MAPQIVLLLLAAEPAPLTFDAALGLAAKAPRVAAAERAVARRQDLTSQVSALPANPVVGVQPGLRANAQGAGLELIGSVAQPLSLAGFGSARREALDRELAHERTTVRLEAHLARLDAAQAWLAVWAAQGVLAEARHELDLSQDLGGRTERAAKAGAVTKADAAALRAWVAEARLAVLAAEGELFDTGVALNRALGLSAGAPMAVADALPVTSSLSDAALVDGLGHADAAPAVRAAAELRAAEEARAHELTASKGTWLQVGATGGREGLGDVVALATVSVTLPAFDTGAREAAPLVAAAARAEGEQAHALVEARAERVQVAHEVEHTRETLEVVEKDLVPASDEAAQGTQRRMEAGEATAQEWVLARRAALAAHSRLVRAHADHALARFRAQELSAVTAGVAP